MSSRIARTPAAGRSAGSLCAFTSTQSNSIRSDGRTAPLASSRRSIWRLSIISLMGANGGGGGCIGGVAPICRLRATSKRDARAAHGKALLRVPRQPLPARAAGGAAVVAPRGHECLYFSPICRITCNNCTRDTSTANDIIRLPNRSRRHKSQPFSIVVVPSSKASIL